MCFSMASERQLLVIGGLHAMNLNELLESNHTSLRQNNVMTRLTQDQLRLTLILDRKGNMRV